MRIPDNVLNDVAIYVKRLFDEHSEPWLLYHNIAHTWRVVQHAAEIGKFYALNEQQTFVLQTAAWFHDAGQLFGDMEMHEQTGVDLMKMYLGRKETSFSIQEEIAACIMATKMPVQPVTLLEKILCDADTYHLGTPDFEQLDNLVWQELALRTHKPVIDPIGKSLQFLQTHTYYTDYCRQLLSAGKEKNIVLLQRKKESETPAG